MREMQETVERELPPLAALVREKHDRGFSYREMSEAARRAGRLVSHSQLAAYASDGVRKAPTPEQMQGIAAALGVSFEKVYAAAIEQYYGYTPTSFGNAGGRDVTAAIPFDLTPEEERELGRVIRTWVAMRRSEEE